ncbi:MAG TPA: HEAT repeat domain-containing protein [Candidatus Methanoperedens sp.]
MKKRQDIEGLLNVLETGDIKECREAIRMLGELRTRKAISPLIGFLETDDVQIRTNAAWALGEIGHMKAVLPLIGLLNDPIENVRINAAWSLGRIGDKRALKVLRYAMKNGSTDLRKHASEAITRIESNENDKWRNSEDADIPDIVDIPLIEIVVPSNMECNYLSRVEDADSQTDYENMARFSRNVQVRDTGDPLSEEDTRKIVLGLKDDSKGLVSVDIIFKYKDNTNGERKSSSVWLQMASVGANGDNKTEREIERIDSKYIKRRTAEGSKKKAKIKHSIKQKPVEYDLPDETDQFEKYPSEIDETDIEEFPEERVITRKVITRREKRQVVREIPEEQEYGYEEETQEIPELSRFVPKAGEIKPEPIETKPDVKPIKEPQVAPPKIPEHPKPEPKLKEVKPEVKPIKEPLEHAAPPIPEQPKEVEIKAESVIEKITPEIKPPVEAAKPATASTMSGNVNSAVQLLSNIGMSGMTNAASTVTQLGGEEAESKHSQVRTIPIEEMNDEITGLGDSVVMIGVELHGNGAEGEVKGEMQMYISRKDALEVANELLCNTPDTAIKEFNDDITSTLKETANIYGGQYVSAISEYIGVPLTLKAPSFKTGTSSQVAESAMKDITGKVEFALATNIEFGNDRIGRLIMLVDPKSFEAIISKLM